MFELSSEVKVNQVVGGFGRWDKHQMCDHLQNLKQALRRLFNGLGIKSACCVGIRAYIWILNIHSKGCSKLHMPVFPQLWQDRQEQSLGLAGCQPSSRFRDRDLTKVESDGVEHWMSRASTHMHVHSHQSRVYPHTPKKILISKYEV